MGVSEHGRSAVAHVRVGANTGWETMPIPLDCKRVPSAGVVAGSPDAGRETMLSRRIANVCQAPALLPVSPMLVGK